MTPIIITIIVIATIAAVILLFTFVIYPYLYDARKTIETEKDKFNNSIVISMLKVCDYSSKLRGADSCSLFYHKDGDKEDYYLQGEIYISFAKGYSNIHKAVDVNSQKMSMDKSSDPRLGYLRETFKITLSKDYLLKGNIEIKLYGHELSKVIKIRRKHIHRFLDAIDKYNQNN